MDTDPKNGRFPSFESEWLRAINCIVKEERSDRLSIAMPSLPPKTLHEQDKFKHHCCRHHPGDLAHVAMKMDQSGPSIVDGAKLLQLGKCAIPSPCGPMMPIRISVRPEIRFADCVRRDHLAGGRA